MNNINDLNEHELLNLKEKIEKRIKYLEEDKLNYISRKDSVKNKTKLSELTETDTIFVFDFSKMNSKICFIDYCDIASFEKDSESDYYDTSISHKTEIFGFSTDIPAERIEKHYHLFDYCSNIYFITMKPNTWEIDLQESLEYEINERKKSFNKELKIFKNEIKYIIKNKKKINDFITD